MSLMRRGRRRIDCAGRARGDDLRDSDSQQDESDECPEPEWRAASEWAGEDEAEKIQRHDAAANDAQTDALRHGALSFDFEGVWDRRRVVIRLRNLPGQSLRHRREIGPAYGAESPSLTLIRSTFWTEHRVSLGRPAAQERYITCARKPDLISPERLKRFSQAALEERHHRHVTVTEQEDEQERDRRVDAAANRIIDREDEIEREGEFDVWQQSPLTTVFHGGHQPVVPSAFDIVFRRAHEAGSDPEQGLQHGARV